MPYPEDAMMHEEPFDVDAQHDQHVHPVMRGVLADALKAAAPAYGRGAHHNAARKIVADIGTLPPHGSPHDAGAKGTDAPSAFDAAAWIERAAPGTLLVAGMISEVVPGLLVQIAEAAYSQGCLDESARFNARLDAIMGARTALAPCPKKGEGNAP